MMVSELAEPLGGVLLTLRALAEPIDGLLGGRVSTLCGAVSTRGEIVFVPGFSDL